MNNEPIPVRPQRAPQKSRGGIKVAGAVAAGVVALGAGAGLLASGPTAQAGSNSTATAAETEQSLPASDLFGVAKPAEPTEAPAATMPETRQPTAAAPKQSTTTTSRETEHETDHQSSGGSSSGGDD